MLTIRHNRQMVQPVKVAPKPEPKHEVLVAKPIVPEPTFISQKMQDAINRVLEKHELTVSDLFAKRRDRPFVNARRHLMKIMYHELKWSAQRIANYLDMDISTVQYHLGLRKRSKRKYGALNDD